MIGIPHYNTLWSKNMEDRIEGISRITRVERVRNYTPAERAAKFEEIEKAAAERAEIREYFAQFPNPEHLSFAELLEQAIKNNKVTDDDIGYILDIKNFPTKK